MLTTYTTYGDVRAALGVSIDELDDATLALKLYDDALNADFDDISGTLRATFTTVNALTTPTTAQARFLACARSFATYSVSRTLLSALPMFGPKSVEDGKAKMDRFSNPIKDIAKRVEGEYDRWRARLEDALKALGEAAATPITRTYASAVAPASNPITGE